MKRFLWAMVIGGIAFFVFCGIVEFYQSRVDNNYSYKYWYMENHRDKVETLLFGDSYMENSINPKLIWKEPLLWQVLPDGFIMTTNCWKNILSTCPI